MSIKYTVAILTLMMVACERIYIITECNETRDRGNKRLEKLVVLTRHRKTFCHYLGSVPLKSIHPLNARKHLLYLQTE